jgi:uncharacterized Zn finger protein
VFRKKVRRHTSGEEGEKVKKLHYTPCPSCGGKTFVAAYAMGFPVVYSCRECGKSHSAIDMPKPIPVGTKYTPIKKAKP